MSSDQVASHIKSTRKDLGITRAQLAAKCAALGDDKLTIAALESIETGRPDKDGARRRHVSVDELLVLAKALNVPPLDLLYPLMDTENRNMFIGRQHAKDEALAEIGAAIEALSLLKSRLS